MAFDITSVLKNVSNSDTIEQMVYLPLDLIDPDPDNFYNMDGVEELAANIELLGLQQPLRVEKKENGRYTVISGHRRRAACIMLADGYGGERNKKFREVPCIVETGQVSEAMRKLRLIYANANTRVMTPWELSEQAAQVEQLLYELKEDGYDFPGRMRDHVAAACKASASKLARLKVIRERLEPEELRADFSAGFLSEAVAYEVAKRAPEDQQHLLREYNRESIRSMTADFVRQQLDITENLRLRRQQKTATPVTPETKQVRAPELPKDDQPEEPEKNPVDVLKATEEAIWFRKLLREDSDKFLRMLGSVADRSDGIERLKRINGSCYSGFDYGTGFANCSPAGLRLVGDGRSVSKSWAEVYDMLCAIALNKVQKRITEDKQKNVSKMDTIRKWATGDPPEIGLYLVVAGYPQKEMDGLTWKTVAKWDGNVWIKEKTCAPFDMNIYRWYRLPDD